MAKEDRGSPPAWILSLYGTKLPEWPDGLTERQGERMWQARTAGKGLVRNGGAGHTTARSVLFKIGGAWTHSTRCGQLGL